jgi:FAD/FMN-containing dehydrogenase
MMERTVDDSRRVTSGDPRYETLVRGFNLRWVGTPEYVELCYDPGQVRDAVQHAVDSGLRITVRGGGHCYEDFVSHNVGGAIIDLSPLSRVYRADDGRYCVEGGATLWNVYTQLYRQYGVTLPAGSCYAVGAGGHVTGGGYGLLSRLHGLTVDFLDAVEVVRVDRDGRAEILTVDRRGDADERLLLWAHQGGGGGNFGVVTKFWFSDLPAAPSVAHLVSLAWNWSDLDKPSFTALVERYGEYFAAHSDVGSPAAGLFALLHLSQRPAGQIGLTAQYVGDDPGQLDALVRAMRSGTPRAVPQTAALGYHGPPQPTTQTQVLPWLYATQTLDGIGRNQRGKYKSAYMRKPFPSHQVDAMWCALSDPSNENPLALLQVDSYGCQVNAVAPEATAVPQRSSIMKLQYQTYWIEPTHDAANLKWIGDFYHAMYGPAGPVPDGTMDGCYVNYPDVDLVDWQGLYYQDAYPQLQRAKARWDPLDVFNHRQSIELPPS